MSDLGSVISDFGSRQYPTFCLETSRVIDASIAKNEVLGTGENVSSLIKMAVNLWYAIFSHTTCWNPLAALMVLMISAKSACLMGWFSTEDTKVLMNMANEITNKYEIDLNTEPSGPSLSVISAIMSRFYPRMEMDRILGFLEVKSGHHFYARDFQFSKDLRFSPVDKIRLFVARADNIETSSCLVTPARVDFFLNGMQVDKRNSSLDSGPQLPMDITPMLINGSNLVQALGRFDGNYIIAVAFMRELPNPDSACLQDYEHDPATVDADCVIIEQASRISLNCPISFGRIKIPVRGRSCKHITCFDFDNYVEINSRRPQWRCPSCNKPACFSDIRLDQNMYKILKEVDANVSAINLYSDGSWTPEIESEEIGETLEYKPSNTVNDFVDLTEDDNDPMNIVQQSGQTSDVPASSLLTYPNREVEAGDLRGSDVASSSDTLIVYQRRGKTKI